MNIIEKLFKKNPDRANIEAHKVVVEKAGEAQTVLKTIQNKMEEVAQEIENESRRSNREMTHKVKKIRDIARQIAIVTGGMS